MNKIERMRSAFAHKESDRVPKGDLGIAPDLMAKLVPDIADDFKREAKARELLGMDLCDTGAVWPKEVLVGKDAEGHPRYRENWGMEYIKAGDDMKIVKPGVATLEDVANFKAPKIDILDFSLLKRWLTETDFFIFGQIGATLDAIMWIAGFENTMTWAAMEPDAIRHMSEVLTEFNIAMGLKYLEHGVHLILIGDDIAYNNGTFLSPDLLDELVFPYHKKIVQAFKKHSPETPVMLHSDGDLTSVMDRIVDCGYDALQSLQHMNFAQIKKKYGDKLTLMGNMDIDHLLPFGTPAEVEKAVHELLDVAAPGGGFILSTSNILTKAVPVENAYAMYRAADKWKYKK